jgi:hypothetical protein
MDMETFGKWCAVGAVAMLIIGFVVVPENTDDRKAFMIECQSDGLKHYQCVSLWNGAGLPVFRSRDMIPLN